jgi:hypothetical protein
MSPVYRLLGIAARVGETLGRTRINFIPISWGVVFGLGVLAVAGAGQFRDAVVNDTKSRAVGISELLAHQDTDRNFVTVKGILIPAAVFKKSKRGYVESSYLALVSVADKRALLVKYAGNRDSEADAAEAEVTGMLETLESNLASELRKTGGEVSGLPIDTELMLVAGRAPGNSLVWGIVTVAAVSLLIALLVARKSHYVVFRPETAPDAELSPSSSPPDGIDLRASGLFQLDARAAQRFLDVPAEILRLESGDLAIVSNIDASSRFFGIKTADRAGLWAIVVRPEYLTSIEHGTLFLGFGPKPALRLSYRDLGNGKPMRAVLSFADAAQRAAMHALIPGVR